MQSACRILLSLLLFVVFIYVSCRSVCVCLVCPCVRLSVFSPKQERHRKDETGRVTITQNLLETGERERLNDLLRQGAAHTVRLAGRAQGAYVVR